MYSTTVDRDQLVATLRDHVIKVTFVKSNGQLRHMRCTTRKDLLPAHTVTESTRTTGAVPAWDMDLGEWRSLRADRVVQWAVAEE